jgi:hypothetical protein
MAAAEPMDDNDDTDDELDRLAEEEFLEWREEEQERQERQWRNPSHAELARRLGQPRGYKEEDQEVDDNDRASPCVETRRIAPPEAPRPAKRWRLERGR